jgi:hypothetical protein
VSDPEGPDPVPPVPPAPPEPAASSPPEPEEPEDLEPGAPEGPALATTPGWVPAAVVAGAVLLIEGFIVSRIRPEGEAGARSLVSDVAMVSYLVGALSLLAGYSAFLMARVPLFRSLEALVLTAVAVVSYGFSWNVALAALGGESATLAGIGGMGLEGKWANLAAVGLWLASAAAFTFSFKWWTGMVWPHFRGWVALNVLAMVHIVVFLLGFVSWLNVQYSPRWSWSTIDLTGTGQFSLSEKTRGVLGKVDGELLVYYVDNGGDRRGRGGYGSRVQDLLRQYQGACPKLNLSVIEALRARRDDVLRTFSDVGMEGLIDGIPDEEDAVVLGFRPPGERLVARTKVVSVGPEFGDVSALGNDRFRGEGILTNAIHEVVFAQRKVAFLDGHGENPISGAAGPGRSAGELAEALRGDNFAVSTINLLREPRVPEGTDVVIAAGPSAPFTPSEVEALRQYLAGGGAVVLLLDVPENREPGPPTGLEDLLDSWGMKVRRDVMIVSWLVEQTLRGDVANPTALVYASRDEFGRHPAMEALKGSSFVTAFSTACPVLRSEKVPEGVDVQELVHAPREVRGYKPFGAVLRKVGRPMGQPLPGDIVDRRLPTAMAAEKKSGATAAGGGRIVVFGDADFATDVVLDLSRETATPGNRSLLLNTISWAVRRDLIAIDPKTVETEMVQLRPIDRDLAFWSMVVALPVLALGVAVGVWWSRRR